MTAFTVIAAPTPPTVVAGGAVTVNVTAPPRHVVFGDPSHRQACCTSSPFSILQIENHDEEVEGGGHDYHLQVRPSH